MSLRVLAPGLHSLVVDSGRPRWRSLGVPVGGAADRFSLAVGNALVGNPPDAAAVEITLAGPTVHADCDLACVVYGAPFELTVEGEPPHPYPSPHLRGRGDEISPSPHLRGRGDEISPSPHLRGRGDEISPSPHLRGRGVGVRGSTRSLAAGKTFTLHAGETLHVGGTPVGLRAYLCVQGGFDVTPVLDSRSALQPLKAGDVLPCNPGVIGARWMEEATPPETEPTVLRFLDGPQADWFGAGALSERSFSVTPASNRMGLRLSAEPLPLPARELVSEPVCPGSVQVTRDGQCIILGVDGQTIGGYPKIAQVISADLDRVGQLRPGAAVRFERATLEEAEAAYRQRRAVLAEWLTRLNETRNTHA